MREHVEKEAALLCAASKGKLHPRTLALVLDTSTENAEKLVAACDDELVGCARDLMGNPLLWEVEPIETDYPLPLLLHKVKMFACRAQLRSVITPEQGEHIVMHAHAKQTSLAVFDYVFRLIDRKPELAEIWTNNNVPK